MKSSKPRVAILTSLVDYSPAYSLVGIILDQCRMLKKAGYDYDLLCLKSFNMGEWGAAGVNEELSVRYILPQTYLLDYQPADPPKDPYKENGNLVQGFDQQVATHFDGNQEKGWIGYKDALKDYDVIIDHDLMFLSWHLPQNAALRKCIDLWPDKNWIHWVHSGPSQPPANVCHPSTLRFSAAPNSTYVYLNNRQKHDYALMIGAPDKAVQVVYNPKDIRDVMNFGSLSRAMIDRYNLMDHEILQVYPFSSPRWRDKGVKQLMRLFGGFKKQGIKAKLVLVNAHCNSKKDQADIDGMEVYAEVAGLKLDEDLILSSRYADEVENPSLRYTVPFDAVRDLSCLSNMFIFPTISECCSLIQAEASIAGKFMVLNRDFQPLAEFCSDNVMHFEFTVNQPDVNPVYYENVAREIWANFKSESSLVNRTMAITKTYNRDWIFKHQLEPLLYLGASEKASKRRVVVKKAAPVVTVEAPGGEAVPLKAAVVERVAPEKVFDVIKGGGPAVVDYENPVDGMDCEIFGSCSNAQRERCFGQSGHCLMLDESKK